MSISVFQPWQVEGMWTSTTRTPQSAISKQLCSDLKQLKNKTKHVGGRGTHFSQILLSLQSKDTKSSCKNLVAVSKILPKIATELQFVIGPKRKIIKQMGNNPLICITWLHRILIKWKYKLNADKFVLSPFSF